MYKYILCLTLQGYAGTRDSKIILIRHFLPMNRGRMTGRSWGPGLTGAWAYLIPSKNVGFKLYFLVTSYKSQVTSHKSQVTSHKSQATSHKSQLTRYKSQVTTHKVQVTTHKVQVTSHEEYGISHQL